MGTRTTIITTLALALGALVAPPLHASEQDAIDFDALVSAVVEVESGGNPFAVGLAGERGLMQIKSGTWADMSRKAFGKPLPFSRAFDPQLNTIVGRTYLQHLASRIEAERASGGAAPVELIAAAYNGGPNLLSSRGLSTRNLSAHVRSYAKRVSSLYTVYAKDADASVDRDTLQLAAFSAPAMLDPDLDEARSARGATETRLEAPTAETGSGMPGFFRKAFGMMPFAIICAFCVIFRDQHVARELQGRETARARITSRFVNGL